MAGNSLEDWVKASHRWARIDLEFTLIIQSLGRQNEYLAREEDRYWRLTDEQRAQPHEIPTLDNLFGISRLWIFGCWELVSTLHKYVKENTPTDLKVKELERLKKAIIELRAPLAKLKKANNKEPLYAISALSRTDGRVGWVLDNNRFITRQQIAEETLRVLLS